ncbi:hypothetical protein XB05_16490 [Xanthomonas arboricola]|nr:hypothetical protein XB05_16490 [Xanthomonas arboricola]
MNMIALKRKLLMSLLAKLERRRLLALLLGSNQSRSCQRISAGTTRSLLFCSKMTWLPAQQRNIFH